MSSPQQGSIAERIALGKEQNSTDGGAIVPFPADSEFADPFFLLRSYDRSWLTEKQNNGYQLTSFMYRSAEGLPIFCVLRIDHPELGKDIRPLRCERVIGMRGDAAMRHLEGARPLYNLDQLAKRPDDPVLIVEGERTTDAAEARFGRYVATTWPGGAQSIRKIELQPLIGRNVSIWPDNDFEGLKAAKTLAGILLKIGVASCRIVNVPEAFPPKWDLADAVPCDTGSEGLQALLDSAPNVDLADVAAAPSKPLLQPKPANSASLSQDESMLRFLIDNEFLNLGGRGDWIRVGLAIKASQGEAGFKLWDRLSSQAPGYDESKIRKEWDTFKDRLEGESILTLATFAKMARDNGWVPPTSPAGRTKPGSSGQDADPAPTPRFGKGHDAAAAAVELAEDAGDEFWLDQHEKAHVTYRIVTKDGEELTHHGAIVSAKYKGILSRRYHDAVPGKVLPKEAASNALALLEYRADESCLRFTSSLRVAEHNECVYVDLGQQDGSAVQIDNVGWRVVYNPPVRFVRGSRGAMPLPELGGTFNDFHNHFNLSSCDVVRTVAFMIGTFNMTGSYPILFIEGEQGTCKSTLADMIVALTDPPTGGPKNARFSFTRDEKDLHVAAKGSRVLYFDNISNIKAHEADALCRMATGAASSSRKLYTDDEEARLVVQRPVIATSIGLPSSRADLLSRCLRVRTKPVKTRRGEEAVMRDFDKDWPKLLGFLFDCVSEALRNREEVEEAVDRGEIALPRMGDFGQFVEGAAAKLGLERGQFSQMVGQEQGELQADSAFTHPVGAALFSYFSQTDAAPINGSASKVLELLRSQSPYQSWWPAANKFRNELTRIAAGLRELGIEFEVNEAGGRDHVMRFHIYVTSAFTPTSATTASGADHF